MTAVGRELLGFIWAIGVTVEREHRPVIRGRRLMDRPNSTAATVAVEGHTERRTLDTYAAGGATRAFSPR